jgi:glycerol kinase
MHSYVMAIDQGTTGTTVLILDKQLAIRSKVNVEFRQIFPKPGWVEHDLDDVWGSVHAGIQKALREAGLRGNADAAREIAAIGITNQRETTTLWDRRSGKPAHNAIVWQDRRTADMCARLKAEGREGQIREKTGLVLDPYFSATKLRWLLDNVRGAREKAESGQLAFGTIDSFLVWRLTGGAVHVTDVSNASRTSLMELRTCSWDEGLLDLFEIPRAVLPEIRSSSEIYGYTKNARGLPDGIPVAGIAGDQQAALFGQACFEPGEAKCTYGTGAFLLERHRAVVSRHTSLPSPGGSARDALRARGSSFSPARRLARDGLKLIQRSSEVTRPDGGDRRGVRADWPGAPHWRPEARGLLAGLTRGTQPGHIARAALEGIAFQIYDLAEAMMKDAGRGTPSFRVDGGAAANDLLMQFQADLLGIPVERPRMIETTALGAAFLSGLAAGVWPSREEISRSFRVGKRFEPKMKADERERHLAKWRRAVAAA